MRRSAITSAVAILALASAVEPAAAHAFLDHASPAVGSAARTPPSTVSLWFTQDLEPAFSSVTVTDQTGQRVDLGNAAVPPGHPDELQIGVKLLPAGSYKVAWHVVSVDTHPTEGSFTFIVGGG